VLKKILKEKIIPFLKKNWDFILIITISLLFSLIRMYSNNLFISVFGFIILLTFPGYSLSFLIFSKKDDLKVIERIGITLFSSIILSSILGAILVYFNNFNLALVNWLFFGANLILSLLGIIFRIFITDSFILNPFQKGIFKKIFHNWMKESTFTKILSIFTIISILGAFASFVFILQFQSTIPGTTIFSVVDVKGNTLSNVRTGENETISFTVKVNNSNINDINYFFEAWVINKTKTDILNNELTNMNITLIKELDFFLNSYNEKTFSFNFTLANIGEWITYFILWENEKPLLDQTSQEQYIQSIIETRIKEAIQPDAEKRIYGLNIPVFILTDHVEDTGDKFANEKWTMSSQGWNWTTTAINSTYGGFRDEGFLYMFSNITSSHLALRSTVRNDLIFNSSSHLYAESRIAPISNISNYHSFGISIDLSIGSPSWYRARLASNTTHLFMGVGSLFTEKGILYSTPTVIPFNWSLDSFHILRIDIDYKSKWISYQCDGIILRNTTLDKDFIVDNYQVTIFVDNNINRTDSAIKMDYYKYGWTKEETPYNSIKNYLIDNGGQFNSNWYTSSEGWDWLPTNGNKTDYGMRISDYIQFYSSFNSSFQGISVPLNSVNFVRSTNQIVVSTNFTYLENSSVYSSFGLAVDLNIENSLRFIAVILSNTTHLKVGIASNYSISSIFYTETIVPFNWSRYNYHLLEIKIDYDKHSIAFYNDNILIRNNIQDFGYTTNIYNATILVENNVNFNNASIRIEDFMAQWLNWNNLSYPSILSTDSLNYNYLIQDCSNNFDRTITIYSNRISFKLLLKKDAY